jgi:hypothetical protein
MYCSFIFYKINCSATLKTIRSNIVMDPILGLCKIMYMLGKNVEKLKLLVFWVMRMRSAH